MAKEGEAGVDAREILLPDLHLTPSPLSYGAYVLSWEGVQEIELAEVVHE